MGSRIIRGIEWVLLEFEARMVTVMIWMCWVFGITSEDVERTRREQNRSVGPASTTNVGPVRGKPRPHASTK